MSATTSTDLIIVYRGFREVTHRIFAHHGTNVPAEAKDLLTVVEPAVLGENGTKRLKTKIDAGLVTYPYAQYWPQDDETTRMLIKENPKVEPFIFRLPGTNDGPFDHVQTWTFACNDAWYQNFNPTKINPDETIFQPARVKQFRHTLRAMLGEVSGNQVPIYLGTSTRMNQNNVYIGTPFAFCKWLLQYPKGSAEWKSAMVDDIQVGGEGKVTTIMGIVTDANGLQKDCQIFNVSSQEDAGRYAFYIKEGHHRMFACTPLDQFMDGRTLLGEAMTVSS